MKKPVDGCHSDPAAASDVRRMAMSHVDKSKSQHRQSRSKLSDRRISQPINVSVRSASALAYFMLTYFRSFPIEKSQLYKILPPFPFHPSFFIPFLLPPLSFTFLPFPFLSLLAIFPFSRPSSPLFSPSLPLPKIQPEWSRLTANQLLDYGVQLDK